MRNNKQIGLTLAVGGLLVAVFTVVSAMTIAPGEEEVEFTPVVAQSEITESMVEEEETTPLTQPSTNTNTSPDEEIESEVVEPDPEPQPANNSSTSLPSRLIIPKLGINAHVQHLGVTASGLMAAPKNFTDVSWYKLGTIPGNLGSAVMSGHEDDAVSLDGVFKHLEDLNVGDEITIVRGDGKRLTFVVTGKEIHPYDLSGPALERIFTETGGAYLRLITCTGDWLPSAKTNDKRLIVFAELK